MMGISKTKPTGPGIYPLDDSGFRYAFAVNGLVRWVGSLEECKRRAALYGAAVSDREQQDRMLHRACG